MSKQLTSLSLAYATFSGMYYLFLVTWFVRCLLGNDLYMLPFVDKDTSTLLLFIVPLFLLTGNVFLLIVGGLAALIGRIVKATVAKGQNHKVTVANGANRRAAAANGGAAIFLVTAPLLVFTLLLTGSAVQNWLMPRPERTEVVVREGYQGTRIYTGDGVDVRNRPSIDGVLIERLPKGMDLPVIGEVKDWYKVELPDGRTGYVAKTSPMWVIGAGR